MLRIVENIATINDYFLIMQYFVSRRFYGKRCHLTSDWLSETTFARWPLIACRRACLRLAVGEFVSDWLQEAVESADRVYLTRVDAQFSADRFFPAFESAYDLIK